MRRLVLAELRSRRRMTAALAAGVFVFLFALGASYQSFGGASMSSKLFGGDPPAAVAAFSGSRSGDLFSPLHYLGFGFNHPLFLVLTLAVAISVGSRSVAGAVEDGRAQLLYSRPVARRRLLLAHVVAWAPLQLLVVASGMVGVVLGSQVSHDLRQAGVGRAVAAAVQYCGLVWFIAAVAFLASSRARSRGAALGTAVGVTALGYLVNFVSLLWHPAAAARWFSPFGYYEPVAVIDHGVNVGHLAVLLGAGAMLVAAAAICVERRDLV